MEQVEELKKSNKINYKEDEFGKFRISVINRGEQLYYEVDDKAFICQILILPQITLFTKSLKKWDNKKAISDVERSKFYDRIKQYFIETDNEEIIFYDK
jgi:hypothetical protein